MRIVTASLAAVAGLVAVATGDPPEPTPYFFLWAAPEAGGYAGMTDFASQIVRVNIALAANDTPEEAAAAVAAAAHDQIEAGVTDPDHICILLQNFGTKDSLGKPTCFWHSDDDLEEPLSQFTNWENSDFRYMQPWMNNARPIVKEWMEDFVTALAYEISQDPTLEAPARFHYDTEAYISGCCVLGYTKALEAAAQDDRWDEEPLPGTVDVTMASLYSEARGAYGWGNGTTTPILDLLQEEEAPNSDANRPLFIWYYAICQAALDQVMLECAYSVIKDEWPSCKVSNYYHCNTDGGLDNFGWHSTRDHESSGQSDRVARRTSVRAGAEMYGEGAKLLWNDIEVEDPEYRSLWQTHTGVASGDFSSPVLYPYHPNHRSLVVTGQGTPLDRYNYYLRDQITETWPVATDSWVMLDYARRWVEAILNTPDGHGYAEIMPWLWMPDETRPLGQNSSYPPSTFEGLADLRQVLAMLRAKRTTEAMLWWNHTVQYPEWTTILEVMELVYTPQLDWAHVLEGTGPDPVDPDILRYTLRATSLEDEVVEVESVEVGNYEQVALWVKFNYLDDWENRQPPILNLECSVSPDEGDANGVRGFIYLADQENDPIDWQQEMGPVFDDFGFEGSGFGYFAPSFEDEERDWYETRRSFPLSTNDYISPYDGSLWVQIVLRDEGPFTARFDLTQLIGTPPLQADCGECASRAQGADFDHSQSVNLTDLLAFQAAYAAGMPSADQNFDGQVTPQDLAIFGIKYNNP